MVFHELGVGISSFSLFVVLVGVWSTVWKGIALWKAARNSQIAWFVVLVILNTAGILEIIYILFLQKKKQLVVNKKSGKK